MARPNKGYESIVYVRVTPENRKYLESVKEFQRKSNANATFSEIINTMLDRARLREKKKVG